MESRCAKTGCSAFLPNAFQATIFEREDSFELVLDAPGMKETDTVSIDMVSERVIHVTMQRPPDQLKGGIILDERRTTEVVPMKRDFELPAALDRTKGDWEIRHGQLKIQLIKQVQVVKLARKVNPGGDDRGNEAKRVKSDGNHES